MHGAASKTSSLDVLVQLPLEERTSILNELSDEDTLQLLYDWPLWARPEQLQPAGRWRYWVIKTGRGWGKSRTGAETVRQWAHSGDYQYVNLIGATADDARDIMVEGESGILAICPPDERPEFRRNAARLDWPSGTKSLIFTADKPERLRGKQHSKLWCDELAHWRYLEDAWDQAMFGLRLDSNPQVVITTTPRPLKLLKELITRPETLVTEGSSYDNRINLAPGFFEEITRRYEGTRLGRQELHGHILEDNPYALWTAASIEEPRLYSLKDLPEGGLEGLFRIVVAIDPSVTGADSSDEAGIIVAGVARGERRKLMGYVLDDVTVRGSPHTWASQAVKAYHRWGADRIIGEQNNGGEMVELTLRTVDPKIPYTGVWASRGKRTRAEPIAALYEQGLVHHVGGFAELEDEMQSWVPGDPSPNRMDALVWALTDLMLGRHGKLAG
jgi:phage terminase large subunit-like protein